MSVENRVYALSLVFICVENKACVLRSVELQLVLEAYQKTLTKNRKYFIGRRLKFVNMCI
jgi:hypothetical protein